MKRSQMLGAIYNYLWNKTDLNEKSLEGISKDLLDLVEKHKMQPPNYLMKSGYTTEDELGNKYACQDDVVASWEPENDS